MIAATATKIEDLTLNITEEIHVKAPLEVRKPDLANDGVNHAVDFGHDQRQ